MLRVLICAAVLQVALSVSPARAQLGEKHDIEFAILPAINWAFVTSPCYYEPEY